MQFAGNCPAPSLTNLHVLLFPFICMYTRPLKHDFLYKNGKGFFLVILILHPFSPVRLCSFVQHLAITTFLVEGPDPISYGWPSLQIVQVNHHFWYSHKSQSPFWHPEKQHPITTAHYQYGDTWRCCDNASILT